MAAHYDIFRHHLLMKFPAYGHALWEPDPGNLYPAVKVGDIGYIREGKFRRLFNVLLPAEDESHEDFGVPEYHEPLTVSVRKHIEIGKLGPNNLCSAKVTSMPVSERLAKGPDEIPKVTFYCPRKEGAVLSLPVQAKTENTVASADFGKWIIRNIDSWFAWARQLGLGVDRMEDIVLVTGTHCTRSCTNVAFPGGQDDAQVSFGAKVDHTGDAVSINWQFSLERNRGVALNYGPEGKDLPEDQCIFIRGFRATRMLKILPPRLKGAAGPNPDPEGDDEEPDAELVPIPALPEYRDPLRLLLEYIAEEAPPNCDMVLVHDDDLARLDGICDSTRLDGLQSDSDVILSHIRRLKPELHNARIDMSSACTSASAEAESACVVTLSNIFENQSPASTSSAPQSFHAGRQPPTSAPDTMARTTATTSLPSNIEGIFNAALKSYKKKTKKDLTKHDLFKQLENCDSPAAILAVFQDKQFDPSRLGSDNVLKTWFLPAAKVLYAFSETLGTGLGLIFSPAQVVFAGVGVLLLAAKDNAVSREILAYTFERFGDVFVRLESRSEVPLTPAMTHSMVEIIVEVLGILATATKEMNQSRARKFVTRIARRTDLELVDGLSKLAMLTDEALVMGFVVVDDVVDDVVTGEKAVGDRNDWINMRDITS